MDWAVLIAAGLSGTAACLVWTVRVLWHLDRRVVRIEEHFKIRAEGF